MNQQRNMKIAAKLSVTLSLILFLISCSRPMEVEKRKKNDLCEYEVVDSFRAIYKNPDHISGRQMIKCENYPTKKLTCSEEMSQMKKANDAFWEICRSKILIEAHLVLRRRCGSFNIVRRNCVL